MRANGRRQKMILGMSPSSFTTLHVALSLIGGAFHPTALERVTP